MKRSIFVIILTGFCLTSTGCAVFNAGREAMVDSTRMFRPRPVDGPVNYADEADEWGFVGSEGRGDQDRERDPDRWWQDMVMSPEARNIERNLGID